MDTDGMQFENPIDNLTYLYDDTNKNQLLRVFDSTANPQGFSDDSDGISDTEDDYAYDDNGNMTHDDNKGITHITYNHLNLPVEIIFGTYGKIAYLYNATGQKLKKTVTEGTTITTTDYLSGFQYKNLVLQFFPHAEGYVNATEEMVVMGGTSYRFNYVFNYTDHLGNIRLSYSLDPSTKVLKIIEENHYYPFGLKHSGYNSDKMMYTKEAEVLKIKPVPPLFITSYKYKYNGKEYQDELGLNMYDYGARNYDPALGRWMNIDPLAEKTLNNSTYNYVLNNPIKFIDPNGMIWVNPEEAKRLKNKINSIISNKNQTILELANSLINGDNDNDTNNLLQENINNLVNDVSDLNQSICDIELIDEDENKFDLSYGGEKNYVHMGNSGVIQIYGADDALHVHEIRHVARSLKSEKGLVFNDDNNLMYTTNLGIEDEIDAYGAQYSFNKNSLPDRVGSKKDIDVKYLANMTSLSTGEAYYPWIRKAYNKRQKQIQKNLKK